MKNNGKHKFDNLKTWIEREIDDEIETIDLVCSGVINLGMGDDPPTMEELEILSAETGLDVTNDLTMKEKSDIMDKIFERVL